MNKMKLQLGLSFFRRLGRTLSAKVSNKSKLEVGAQKTKTQSSFDPATGNSIYPEYFPWV
ncbi:hypothetical protein ACN1C3_16585 [Pseudomonas sp. H11T01]|uniref:hypothetical protein n=1 Tax=Pseudomonas sp. H11T01 TaxID=3402749 RepID=UPI003ABF78AE